MFPSMHLTYHYQEYPLYVSEVLLYVPSSVATEVEKTTKSRTPVMNSILFDNCSCDQCHLQRFEMIAPSLLFNHSGDIPSSHLWSNMITGWKPCLKAF